MFCPLTSIPHSLAHFDGSMISNSHKSDLTALFLAKLSGEDNNELSNIDVDIIDGFDLLASMRESPLKYGHFATFVLDRVCRTDAREIHIIFDKFESPSPRDPHAKKEKDLYDTFPASFKITGPNQQRTTSLSKCLANQSFKEELVNFLVKYWSIDDVSRPILGGTRVFLSFGSQCYLFSNDFEKGKSLESFINNYYDVESKVIWHMSKIRKTNIRIQKLNPDTLLIYLLYHMQYWPHDRNVWIEAENK